MKGLLVLLCVFAAAQARSTGVHQSRELAVLGENPWIVHLRLAVATGGLLRTCAGSLIGDEWVLTSSSCVEDQRFIWVRLGLVTPLHPSRVLETSVVHRHRDLDIAIIQTNRDVGFNDYIGPVGIATKDAKVPESAKYCGFGADDNGGPGTQLACFNMNVEEKKKGILTGQSEDGETTSFDLGAPLVVDGVQYGVLVKSGEKSVFINPAVARDWIRTVTGLDLGPDGEDCDSDEGDGEDDSDESGSDSDESSSESKSSSSESKSSSSESKSSSSESKSSSSESKSSSSESKSSSSESKSSSSESKSSSSESKSSSSSSSESDERALHIVN